MKRSVILIMVTLLFIVSCSSNTEVDRVPEVQQEVPTLEQEDTPEMVVEDDEEMEMGASEPTTKEFTIIARNWEFEPETITVSEGDTVILHLTTEDVSHGYSISEFGVHASFGPGETKTVEFVADKKGTFTTHCSVPCGSGHSSMKGTLIVE